MTAARTGLLVLVALAGCHKVPLIEQQGHLDKVSAHWFENEGVAYAFFSVTENPELLKRSYWEMRYTLRTATGGTELHDWQRIDFSAGVHLHQLKACGAQTICGSYSFKADKPLDTFAIKLNYDPESTLFLEQKASAVQAHEKGTDWTQHSALVFGTFDEANQHVEARVHHNFGDPSSDEIPNYGMTRRFRLREPGLLNAAVADIDAAVPTNSAFLFDAGFCPAKPAGAVAGDFSGEKAWMKDTFPTDGGETGVCFTADFLDKAGGDLFTGSAFARKNPEVTPSSYAFETPLRSATQLPIVLRYCEDDGQFPRVTDQAFFDYQRYITNVPERPVDLCFKVGAEDQFKDAFTKELAARLSAAKVANQGVHDFVFTVIFHQDLSTEFRKFHQIIAEALAAAIDGETANVTPRLVGAFVYDARVDFRPTAAQRKGIIWCPQQLPTGLDAIFNQPDGFNDNCLVTPTAKLDLTVINFVTPLGPFPTLKNYKDYVKKYGDRGTAHAPHLSFSSVPTGPNTRQEVDETVTFFDGERLTVQPGEIIKVCLDRGQPSMLPELRFRVTGTPESEPSLKIDEVAALWSAETTEATEYQMGVAWEFPFVGREDYEATLSGNVVAVIPFQRSSTTYERLGNAKWLREKWPVGESLDICHRFCGFPYFDEAGVYQIDKPWKERDQVNCPASAIPKFEAPA